MRAISIDVENEFSEIGEEVGRLTISLSRLRLTPPQPGSHEAWEAVHICASAAEKIYTGFERVMASIAANVDAAPIPHLDGWHRSLLRRMANDVPGIRAPVISSDCYQRLDRPRAFRHRERNTYGLGLDFDIVLERCEEIVGAFDLFRREVRSFLARPAAVDPPAGA
ncbi:ribonuclease toxin HepT-like protein [Methylobacterium trifolii]|uniref:HepT-like domain-containing protein n=1 Tax=Methylobacterium trifolii TaxID=1003092 RepID=A0ABQ4TXN0_9HYPH|nr:hypothetical protein [Methylobacterium trifolii]GJE58355.1 hypothetical protein MPOCJGCO_0434 [Methylobacterium trifolii]